MFVAAVSVRFVLFSAVPFDPFLTSEAGAARALLRALRRALPERAGAARLHLGH
jgi:hypothetical protein